MQDPAAAIGTLGFDEAEAAKKREGLSKHQRTAADLSFLIFGDLNDAVGANVGWAELHARSILCPTAIQVWEKSRHHLVEISIEPLQGRTNSPLATTQNGKVTGVQTCALPIYVLEPFSPEAAWAGEDTQIARAIQVLAAA